MSNMIVFIVVLLTLHLAGSAAYSCRGHDGQPVDWFVAYKHPASKSYVYRSSSSSSLPSSEGQWNESSFPIDSPDSLPGRTLQPLYSDVQLPSDRIGRNRFVLMYNDELPNGTTSGELHAHAKGVVAFDWTYQTGFWMIHSVPRFPPAPDGPSSRYAFPPSGLIYGQTMICVTLPLHQADLVGGQLLFYRPAVYHRESGEEDLQRAAPQLVAAATGQHVTRPPWSQEVNITSVAGTNFTSFAKARDFGLDIYGDWMAGALKTSLHTETWTNGQGRPLPSACFNCTFTVENIQQVRLTDTSDPFGSHKDHSKWAVSTSPLNPWACVGDINRMDSQRHRGGGSLCLRQKGLWQAFHRSVNQLEACPLTAKWLKKKKKKTTWNEEMAMVEKGRM